jgi:hypothetical protein
VIIFDYFNTNYDCDIYAYSVLAGGRAGPRRPPRARAGASAAHM